MSTANSKNAALIGRLAVQLKLISMDQLNEATREQSKREGARLGDVFLEMGLINDKQLQKLETVQRDLVKKHRAKQAAASRDSATAVPKNTLVAPGAGDDTAPEAAPKAAAPEASPQREVVRPPRPEPVAARVPTPSEAGDRATEAAAALAGLEKLKRRKNAAAAPQSPAAAAPAAAPARAKPAVAAAPSSDVCESLDLAYTSAGPDEPRLHQILADAVAAGASDVHVHAGAPIKFRVNGEMVSTGGMPLSADEAEQIVLAALTEDERVELAVHGELDVCCNIAGIGRFRTNLYRQQRGFDGVFRSIPAEPPTLEELGLPNDLARFTNFHQGMVLLTGPAGCGKSATMAALVNLINEERSEHILTVEDPIETVHKPKRCLVNQRHAGKHTSSFARALRAALREDPDIIVIGELRDLETISLAMTAAETGHFVLATLHTNNAVRTINRMIGAFPSNRQDQVRTMLSESLRAVISQRLVPTADGQSRVPALEILVMTKAIQNLVRDEKTVQIRSAMQTGTSQGMFLLEQSLSTLVREKKITLEQAQELADDPKLLKV